MRNKEQEKKAAEQSIAMQGLIAAHVMPHALQGIAPDPRRGELPWQAWHDRRVESIRAANVAGVNQSMVREAIGQLRSGMDSLEESLPSLAVAS